MRFYPKNSILTMLFVLLALQTVAQKPYHGAEVYSKDAVLYGKFVMRMKMAKGSGMLSTFFTFKGNSHETGVFWEELDIEVFGKENATILGTNIITDGVDGPTSHSSQDVYLNYSLADDYHTYTLEWTPDYVAWFIDGVEYRRVTGGVVSSLTSPQSYRFNAWISCSPEWVGPIDAQRLPQFQKVDWIEYHSYNNGQFELEWRDDFQTFDDSRWAKANWTFDCNEVDFTADNVSIVDGKLVLAITDPADQPVADAGADHTVCDEDRNGFESVLLDGSKSIASSGGSIQNYEWFAGGTLIGEGEILEHEFGEGEQIVSLKITDNYSNTATDKVVVKVQPCLFTLLSDSELPDGVTYMATNWYSLADENSSVAEVQMVTGGADDTSKGAMISYSGIGGGSACEEWQPNTNYSVGTVVTYKGSAYTSTNDWNSDAGAPDQATWGWEPGGDCGSGEIFAGMGFDIMRDGSPYDLTGSSGISFYHKGPACQLEIKQTAVTDYAYYRAQIPAHSSWTRVDLEWEDFAQPSDWGEAVAWDPSDIQSFQWKRVATEGEVDELWIDEVKILGLEFSPVYTSILNLNEQKEMDVLIYPNPVNDLLNIKKLNGNYSLGALYGMDGRFYTSFNLINQNQYCVSLEGIKEGKYLLVLNSNSGVTKSLVIVKAESDGF